MLRPILAVLSIILAFSTTGYAQCYNCSSNFPGGILSTTSSSLTTVTTCAWGGDYSFYNVSAGQTYTWTTCGSTAFDTQLTLFQGATCGAGAVLGYNDDACGLQSTITWTATFTGTVTLLTSQFFCSNNFTCIPVYWACTSCSTTGVYNNPGGTITTCSGTFFDTGGAAGVYANSQSIITTFCPSTPGQCISMNFSSFNTETGFDDLQIYNGNSIASPLIGTYEGTQLQGQTVSATTANASGCLTFWFTSDGSVTYAGWQASISCVTCGDPPPATQEDCAGAVTICDDETFSGNSSGPGMQELNLSNQGCLAYENQSSWFFFSPTTPGTIAFVLNPTPPVDYDFAIWGPYTDPVCPPTQAPLRCSWSALSTATGLQAGAGDNTEGAGGDALVNPITVTAADVGKVYMMFIDNWSASTTPYVFDWNNTGVILDCDPILVLPVELLDFHGYHLNGKNYLEWSTATETNADYFIVERSGEDFDFKTIGTMAANGNSTVQNDYQYTDFNIENEGYYYRLKQVDYNGNTETYRPIHLGTNSENVIVELPYPNPLNTTNVLTIPLWLNRDQNLTFQLFDTAGLEILVQKNHYERGQQEAKMNFSNVPRGSYQLRVLDDQGMVISTTRVVK